MHLEDHEHNVEALEFDDIPIRLIQAEDLDTIIRIDAKNTGYRREDYLKSKLRESLDSSSIQVSLVAEHDGCIVGFIMGEVYYGEFGQAEKVARLDTLGVHPDFARRGIAKALLHQFLMNIKALHVAQVETLVDWDRHFDLMGFFRKAGFKPGKRLHLSLDLDQD